MAENLKPCPFCGGAVTVARYDNWWSVIASGTDPKLSCRCRVFMESELFHDEESKQRTREKLIEKWNKRSNWHTGTPTENGYYLCKVFYDKDTPNDMRILEWVSSLNCFCIPYSKIRAYHYYVGENNGEDVEVVYEWQKLDMRFRMETKWIEPYKEKEK